MTTPLAVPPADPRAGVMAHRAEVDAAIARVLDRGRYILGPEVEAFEHEFAAYLGVGHAVGVASGTDALVLALRAIGVGPGDEVITVSHTAVATVAAIELCGATPVLADIDLDTYALDPDQAAAALSPRTRALVPVHLYGQAAPMEPLRAIAERHGVRLIEDCAQSHGATDGDAKTGTIGAAAAFSFYPTKNLAAVGDAGAVVTADPGNAGRVRELREYGWRERYVSEVPGVNSRLDEIQAAILRVRLSHLDEDNARRVALAEIYSEHLRETGLALPVRRAGCRHVYHQYVVRHPRRDALRAELLARGIGTLIHYPVPVHRQPAYRGRVRAAGPLPRTDEAAATVLSLPIYPELDPAIARRVAEAIREAARSLVA